MTGRANPLLRLRAAGEWSSRKNPPVWAPPDSATAGTGAERRLRPPPNPGTPMATGPLCPPARQSTSTRRTHQTIGGPARPRRLGTPGGRCSEPVRPWEQPPPPAQSQHRRQAAEAERRTASRQHLGGTPRAAIDDDSEAPATTVDPEPDRPQSPARGRPIHISCISCAHPPFPECTSMTHHHDQS